MTASVSTTQPSAHLSDEQLYNVAFTVTTLSADDSAHLATCTACRQLLTELQLFSRELHVAQLSQPSAAATGRYIALFAETQVNATNPLAGVTAWFGGFADAIKASVMWNGREQLALQGVRTAMSTSYRMLYSTEQAEIELMIEPVAGQFTVEGELLPVQSEDQILPVLLELYQRSGTAIGHTPVYSGESDSEGRFHIPPMPAGEYSLCLVPPEGTTMLIDALELV